MNEIDDIKRRAGITEGNNDETHEALVSAHAMLHRLYMDIHEGKLDNDRTNGEYINRTLNMISERLAQLNKFTGMNIPR